MIEPERLLESGGTLARRLLESATVERPSVRSLERTMATLAQQDRVRPRTLSRIGGLAPIIMHSSILRKRRKRQWPLLAFLATASFLTSVVVSYHWSAKTDAVSSKARGGQSASVDLLDRGR